MKATILKRLDEAIADDSPSPDIDELLDNFNEINALIEDVKKSMQ